MKNHTKICLAALFVVVASAASYTAINAAVNWAIPMPESAADNRPMADSIKSVNSGLLSEVKLCSADAAALHEQASDLHDEVEELVDHNAGRAHIQWDSAVQFGKPGACFVQWKDHAAKPNSSGELVCDGPRYIIMNREDLPIYCKYEPIVSKEGDEWVITFKPES